MPCTTAPTSQLLPVFFLGRPAACLTAVAPPRSADLQPCICAARFQRQQSAFASDKGRSDTQRFHCSLIRPALNIVVLPTQDFRSVQSYGRRQSALQYWWDRAPRLFDTRRAILAAGCLQSPE